MIKCGKTNIKMDIRCDIYAFLDISPVDQKVQNMSNIASNVHSGLHTIQCHQECYRRVWRFYLLEVVHPPPPHHHQPAVFLSPTARTIRFHLPETLTRPFRPSSSFSEMSSAAGNNMSSAPPRHMATAKSHALEGVTKSAPSPAVRGRNEGPGIINQSLTLSSVFN